MCAFCQATKKQMQGANELQAMTTDSPSWKPASTELEPAAGFPA
jgi:hypothetical protein